MPARQSKPSSHCLKVALAAIFLSLLAGSAIAATFNVDTTGDAVDVNPGDGICLTAADKCSLRAAVQQANALGGVNTINVPPGTYVVDPALGRITITNAAGTLTIIGTGASGTSIVDGADLATLFTVQAGTATFNNLVLQRGYSMLTDPGIFGLCIGPALLMFGTDTVVNITSSILQDNHEINGSGGAICVANGTLNLDRSTVRNNTSTNGGGGIRIQSPPALLNVTNSTISGNTVTNPNGGSGGAITAQTSINISNSTISGNSATQGAAVWGSTGVLALTNVTVTGNSVGPQLTISDTTAVLASTIVANPVGGVNCQKSSLAVLTSNGHNLDSANSCAFAAVGDLVNTDPLLGALANNGGPTATHALLAGSPAINAGSNPLAFVNDQRGAGFPRVNGAAADIGAFETNDGAAPLLQGAVSRKVHGGAGTFDLPLALTPANPTTEPRQGPLGQPDTATVVLTFDKPITAASASVTEGTAIAGLPTFAGNAVTVPLTGLTTAKYVTVTLTNVAAADGATGGGGAVRIGFLFGDVDQSKAVTLTDALAVNALLTQTVSAGNYLRDLNVDGALTLSDKLVVNANLTQFLPAP